MSTVSIAVALAKCKSAAGSVQLWLDVYFVYSDVVSIEWSQCQVDNSWPTRPFAFEHLQLPPTP